MKQVFILFFILLVSSPVPAQMLDGLYEEEDFKSSLPIQAQPGPAEKPKAETAPAAQNQPKPTGFVNATPKEEKKAEPPKTFEIPDLAEKSKPVLPMLGTNKDADGLPMLGKKSAKKNEDEGLSLFEMRVKRSGKKGEAPVDKFDVAGIRLKMNPEETIETATQKGFVLKSINRHIPELSAWKYKRTCLQGMPLKYNDLKDCITRMAKDDASEYIQNLFFENKARREKLQVDFTSFYSGNHAFRIRYVSRGDHSLGVTDEGIYLKSKRRQDFFRSLIGKYGRPDDEKALIWGGAGFGAMLTAEISDTFLDATIVLEDVTLEDEDFDKMSSEDAKEKPDGRFNF